MSGHLVVSVRLHDARYHGVAEWPPAPARLFQALLSGAALGRHVPEQAQRTLQWLEEQPPPLIAAPYAREGQAITNFVPNNDADSLGGDLSLLEKIRAQKTISPRLLASAEPLIYAWPFHGTTEATDLELVTDKLYQFGRGADMAWARAEVLSDDGLEDLLSTYYGTVHRATAGASTGTLACPMPGSLQSLLVRYEATTRRLRMEGEGRAATWLFVQPPKPRFAQVSYNSPSPSSVFQLVQATTQGACSWRLRDVVRLVETVRDVAARKLCDALPRLASDIQGALTGRRPGEAGGVSAAQRVRIVPLPSIGHEHADRAVRRMLVEVPHGCPLQPDDVFWAFSGQVFDATTGEFGSITLIPQQDRMRTNYERPARRFRTVTPAALPESAKRRRIEPTRKLDERKSAEERTQEEQRATAAVRVALRHAGVRIPPLMIAVQREPFDARGARAEDFAPRTRFEKERLWHVEIEFAEPVSGALTIGDGRFLGLGLLVPEDTREEERGGVLAFEISMGRGSNLDRVELVRALRRAIMARVQAEIGRSALPAFFSGHDAHGDAAQSETDPHILLQYDPSGRLLVIAPHAALHRRATHEERGHWRLLCQALREFEELRAGRAGLLSLRPKPVWPDQDPIFARAREWFSLTPYTLCRHPKKNVLPSAAMVEEIRAQCLAHGFPKPEVDVHRVEGVAGRGIQGLVRLTFAVAVEGPLVLGRTRHLGGGLFQTLAATRASGS